jgi:uncharacterized protein YgfB (UPF0149 family)
MSDHRALPIEYDALRDSLVRAGAVLALPELHGGICGALCASGPAAAETWLDEGLVDEPQIDAEGSLRRSLRNLVGASWEHLSSAALEFEPLLPDVEAPLHEQVQALAAWCHGFLGGLGFVAPDLGMPGATAPDGSPLAVGGAALLDPAAVRARGADDGAGTDSGNGDGAHTAAVDLHEICADFVEISRAGLDDDDAADRDSADFALAELHEYVRVSVQIAFETLAARRASLSMARDLH